MGMISFLKQNKSEAKKVEEAIKVEEQPKVEEIVKAEVVETIVDKPVVEEAIKVYQLNVKKKLSQEEDVEVKI